MYTKIKRGYFSKKSILNTLQLLFNLTKKKKKRTIPRFLIYETSNSYNKWIFEFLTYFNIYIQTLNLAEKSSHSSLQQIKKKKIQVPL